MSPILRSSSKPCTCNIATLTRLGLFCETMRLFLRALRWEHPELRPGVPEGLLGVVPRDVVYSREAGVAPSMPPCGRR